ncbi:hypothetical protein [Phnomibacter sp. MR]
MIHSTREKEITIPYRIVIKTQFHHYRQLDTMDSGPTCLRRVA